MTKRFQLLLVLSLIFGTTGYASVADDSAGLRAKDHLARAIDLLDTYRGDSTKLETAKTLLEEIVQKDPDNAAAFRELARYYIMRGHISYQDFRPGSLDAAEASVKKALEINPDYAEAYVLAGHLYRLMKRPVDARNALSRADALGTEDPWLQNNWADVLLDDGKYEEAAQRYQKVIDSETNNQKAMVVAFEGLGAYYKSIGRLDEADAIYRKTIAYEPESAWNHGNYAQFLLCMRDDYETAMEQAARALQIMNYGVGRNILASALYRKWADQIMKGETVAANESFANAAAKASGSPTQIVASICGNCAALKAVRNVESWSAIRR